MRLGTLVGLVFLVALLAALWWQKEREVARGGPELGEYPLCPGLELERVRAVRVDQLERGFQLGFERDAAGRWFLTDPLAYPAQTALVRMLLTSLANARAEPAPEVQAAQVGLEPPKVVLECVQLEDGGERTLRVELGTFDHDPARIYARVPGHPAALAGGTDVFRTTRSLATTLDRNPDDYRERHALSLRPDEVIALRRSGQVQLEPNAGRVDLAFDALVTPDGWKSGAGTAVSLDPNAMGLFVRGACELSAERFVDDSPSDLTRWGLAPPAFTLELESLGNPPVQLDFGHEPSPDPRALAELRWYVQRRGFAHVWEAKLRDVQLLSSPADLFFDQLVVRALRSDVLRLELEGGGGRRVLERDKKAWVVREARGTEPAALAAALESAPRHPGNPGAIEEALGLLESLQLAEHLEGEAFEPCDPPLACTLVTRGGVLQGGRIGRATRDPKSAAQGRQFLRFGDELVALVDERVVELCERPLDAFRARKLQQIQESEVRMIELEHAGTTYAFVNTGDNLWNPRGQGVQAPQDFLQSLDGLLNLGAQRWLDAAPPHEVQLTVRIFPREGETRALAFGRCPDGSVVCLAGELVAEVDGALVERLLKLF